MGENETVEVEAVRVPQLLINNVEAELRLASSLMRWHDNHGIADELYDRAEMVSEYSDWGDA